MDDPREFETYEARAVEQLGKVLGPDAARAMVTEVMRRAGVPRIRSASDLLLVAEGLIVYGGVPEIVGRSMKVHAVLRGARAEEAAAH